jgi:hypothetical protein
VSSAPFRMSSFRRNEASSAVHSRPPLCVVARKDRRACQIGNAEELKACHFRRAYVQFTRDRSVSGMARENRQCPTPATRHANDRSQLIGRRELCKPADRSTPQRTSRRAARLTASRRGLRSQSVGLTTRSLGVPGSRGSKGKRSQASSAAIRRARSSCGSKSVNREASRPAWSPRE